MTRLKFRKYKFLLFLLILILIVIITDRLGISFKWCDNQANSTSCNVGIRWKLAEGGSYYIDQNRAAYGCFSPWECWCVNGGQCYKGIKYTYSWSTYLPALRVN